MGDTGNLVVSWRSVMMAMVCLPIIISAVILWFRSNERPAGRLLSALLISTVLAMGPQIIGFSGFYDVWPGLTYLPLFSTALWMGPLIYLHAYKLTTDKPLTWRKYLLLPGVFQTLYYCWVFFTLGDYKAKWAYNKAFHNPVIKPIETALIVICLVSALVMVWRLTRRYRKFLKETQSTLTMHDPVWLRNFLVAFLIGGTLYVGLEVIWTFYDISYNAAFPVQVVIMLSIAWLSIDATWRLTSPFPKMEDDLETALEVSKFEPQNGLSIESVKSKIFENEWYLEPLFSIRDLAARLGTNETYVSRALNAGEEKGFNYTINAMRVEFAKLQLSQSDTSILSIALESGFNSKATFNRVFRHHTGETPSRYRTSQYP